MQSVVGFSFFGLFTDQCICKYSKLLGIMMMQECKIGVHHSRNCFKVRASAKATQLPQCMETTIFVSATFDSIQRKITISLR